MGLQESAQKLDALVRLGRIAGNLPGQREQAIFSMGVDSLMAFGECLVNPSSSDVSRAAAAAALDLLCPGWRKASPNLQGPIVKRSSGLVQRWREDVFKRDGYKCRKCGAANDLHAHHLIRWAEEPMLRISVDNGLTLCAPCHVEEHHG